MVYRVKRPVQLRFLRSNIKAVQLTYNRLNFHIHLFNPTSFFNSEFKFLNKKVKFIDGIDWNYSHYGSLWTYNLNYFDYLNQKDLELENAIDLINNYINNNDKIVTGWDPYPVSTRIINWIKFYSYNKDRLEKNKLFNINLFNSLLYRKVNYLKGNLEYHIMANHLYENFTALFFAAYYLNDHRLYTKSKKLIRKELNKQILKDGGHFEQSPMYQQIVLFRLLDTIKLITSNKKIYFDLGFLNYLLNKASLMMSWLHNITFSNGQIPLFNDSAKSIAPTTDKLSKYFKGLVNHEDKRDIVPLNESGYRKICNDKYELILDIGEIKANYQPGHTHSDIFNFELHYNCKPIIVDTGTSTYENNELRKYQRSTQAHNTVCINHLDPIGVWHSFRVGERTKVVIEKESNNFISAYHYGYRTINVIHKREFYFEEKHVIITDHLISNKDTTGILYLHLHPDFEHTLKDKKLSSRDVDIEFSNNWTLDSKAFEYAPEFNKTIRSNKLKVLFKNSMSFKIIFKNLHIS